MSNGTVSFVRLPGVLVNPECVVAVEPYRHDGWQKQYLSDQRVAMGPNVHGDEAAPRYIMTMHMSTGQRVELVLNADWGCPEVVLADLLDGRTKLGDYLAADKERRAGKSETPPPEDR